MDFLKLIQSLDELLYEVMSWLIFYPLTLWRAITRPLRMMDYSDAELSDVAEKQYTDTLSPPLFLLLTLILIHVIELATVGQAEVVTRKVGLSGLVSNDTNLIVLRVLIYSLFPLVMATRLVSGLKQPLERETLRRPFYSQCYATAPFALTVGIGEVVARLKFHWAAEVGLIVLLLACLWYGLLQAKWFAEHLRTSFGRGFWNASVAMVVSLVVVTLAALPFR